MMLFSNFYLFNHMHISKETAQQTQNRLLKVIKESNFQVLLGEYYFKEFTPSNFTIYNDALAFIKDEDTWSCLIPAEDDRTEKFKIFSFHFIEGLDNSGFVGWLATELKKEFGTGVFVICGKNSSKGGIFDYWGCPVEVAEKVFNHIHELRK